MFFTLHVVQIVHYRFSLFFQSVLGLCLSCLFTVFHSGFHSPWPTVLTFPPISTSSVALGCTRGGGLTQLARRHVRGGRPGRSLRRSDWRLRRSDRRPRRQQLKWLRRGGSEEAGATPLGGGGGRFRRCGGGYLGSCGSNDCSGPNSGGCRNSGRSGRNSGSVAAASAAAASAPGPATTAAGTVAETTSLSA